MYINGSEDGVTDQISKGLFGNQFVSRDASQNDILLKYCLSGKKCAVRQKFHAHEIIFRLKKRQPSPNAPPTLDFVEIAFL